VGVPKWLKAPYFDHLESYRLPFEKIQGDTTGDCVIFLKKVPIDMNRYARNNEVVLRKKADRSVTTETLR
jgi:hypothetical protein